MNGYIINEEITFEERSAVEAALAAHGYGTKDWPVDAVAEINPKTDVAILIIQEDSTEEEEARAILCAELDIRIVCIYVNRVSKLSPVAEAFCSARVLVGSAELGAALKGDNNVQQDTKGEKSKKNPQKHNKCK